MIQPIRREEFSYFIIPEIIHEGEVRKGNGLREVWYKTSIDNGVTWSDAVNITTQVHRPKQPQINTAYNFAGRLAKLCQYTRPCNAISKWKI